MPARSCRVRRLLLAVVTGDCIVGNVQHLRIVSDSGRAVCLVKPVNVDPMLYSGFLYLCILPLPCSLQSPSRQWRAVTSRRGLFCVSIQPAGDFPFTIAGCLVMNVHGAGGSLEQVGKIMRNCCCHLCWGIFPGRGLVTGVA